jgi:hypothetical protein
MAKVSYANMKLKMNENTKEVQLGETKIEVKQYLPVEEKYSFLNIVLQNSLENDIYHPVKVDMYFHLYLVYLYTNINFTDKQKEDESKLFDILLTNGIIGSVIATMPKDEYDVLVSLLNQTIEKNEKYKTTFAGIVGRFINDLPAQADAAMKIVENFDPNKFQEVIAFAQAANGGRPIK